MARRPPSSSLSFRPGISRPAPPPTRHPDNGLADYILAAKYARFRRDLGRRETFAEAVERVEAMHRQRFRDRLGLRLDEPRADSPEGPADRRILQEHLGGMPLSTVIHRAFAAVTARRVLPSMRSLQFGGDAILRNQARLFNCSFSPIDRLEFFREYLFLLLAGTGCGFSVQRHHVERLASLPPRGAARERPRQTLAVPDTTEGWADALHFLVRSHWEGFQAEFSFAPAQLPLRQALTAAAAILDRAAGRRLRPIEAYDLCLVVAGAVLGGGGSRRSATICLFSYDDEEMAAAKTGDWLERHPARASSNNSAVVPRAGGDQAVFRRLLAAQREFGEPGFYFSDHPD